MGLDFELDVYREKVGDEDSPSRKNPVKHHGEKSGLEKNARRMLAERVVLTDQRKRENHDREAPLSRDSGALRVHCAPWRAARRRAPFALDAVFRQDTPPMKN
jgi:hypothetical protein